MKNELNYKQVGDYLIPDIELMDNDKTPIGKYGQMRRAYLQEHRPILYNQLVRTQKLFLHLREIDQAAQSRLDEMMPHLAKEAGATEELKAQDQLKWVGLMNSCKAQAEEIILQELIYN